MVDRTQGRKKSNFQAQTSVLSGATFDYVVNDTNYKITYTDLLAELGATGTLEQEGAVTGTPILETVGSVNNIRNLEPGSGISTSVSAENGATIEHNFRLDSVGVELSDDFTTSSPIFRSIVAGAGINVSGSGDEIQIALTDVPASTKTTVINSFSDLPTPVASVITLEDDTNYLFTNDVNVSGNRFVLGDNCVISGADNIIISITYTGSGVMFTSASNWTLKNVTVVCTSGTFLDFNGTGVEIMQIKNAVIDAGILGTIDDIAGVHFDDMQFNVATDGLLFGGANGVVLLESTLGTIEAGTMLDLGVATFASFSITDGFTTLNGTSVYLDGAASSANIDAGGLGAVHNCRFFGAGTPLQTITNDDLLWQFLINDDISDTHRDCLISLTNNATATVIAAVDTPTLIAGTWVPEHESQFTGDVNGRCTYNGIKDIHVDVSISISSAPVSGSNKILGHYVAKNGTEISNSEAKNNISAGDLSRSTVLWRTLLSTGDYIEAFVENETDAVDILVTDAVIRVS